MQCQVKLSGVSGVSGVSGRTHPQRSHAMPGQASVGRPRLKCINMLAQRCSRSQPQYANMAEVMIARCSHGPGAIRSTPSSGTSWRFLLPVPATLPVALGPASSAPTSPMSQLDMPSYGCL
eukprot:353925-Chlamydomonas_euryale.AAC.1